MGCLPESTVVDLVDGRVDDEARDVALRHAEACAPCRRTLAGAMRLLAPTVAERALAVPFAVGRYVVVDFVGEGSMGAVYRAHDPSIDRDIALKIVPPELASTELRDRLLREARAMGRLAHPNVLAVFDAGSVDDAVFVASELVDGSDLRTWLAAAPRDRSEVLHAFTQAGLGLAAAHRAGLVHLDFKPENVLVGRDGRVRVADFGLAALDGTARAAGGTPQYMAPEQRDGDRVDARADQYAFAVALAEALGRDTPRALQRALDRARAERPDDRHDDMHDLLAALAPARAWPRVVIACVAVAVVAAIVGVAASSGGEAAYVPAEPDPALAEARALAEQGEVVQAEAAARSVLLDAQRQGDLPRIAEAELLLGKALAPAARTDDAIDMLWRAAADADAVGRHELQAEALIVMAAIEARDPAAADRAVVTLERARRIVDAHALDDRLGHALDFVAGTIDFESGRPAPALAHFERALAKAERVLPDDHPFLAQYRWSLGVALTQSGRHREGLAVFREAQRRVSLAATTPRAAILLANIASEVANLGGWTEAVPDLERALAILDEHLGAGSEPALDVRRTLGWTLFYAGRTDAAREHLRTLVELAVASGSTPLVAEAYAVAGDLEWRVDEDAAAKAAWGEGLAWASRGAAGTEVEARLATRVGLVDLEEGEVGRARDRFEHALAIYEAQGGTPLDVAETEFALARALGSIAGELPRAIDLATRARDRIAGEGAVEAEHREEMDAWLAARSSDAL